jgi:hypothetical protein
MNDQKELRRVMEIVRANARAALIKHDTQRESFLAYCRNNWKRYAAGTSRRVGMREPFAAALDSATRELLALAEAAPDEQSAREMLRGDPTPDWDDTVEGAMDSVITHEAYQAPALPPDPTESADPAPTVEPALPVAPPPDPDPGPPPEPSEHQHAEEEDRLTARYGFRSPADEAASAMPRIEAPAHALELQRKVRAVLMAHRPDRD